GNHDCDHMHRLSMASIYPTALTFAERRMKITGQVTGFLIVGGSAGGMIVPALIGQMFESIGPRVMMFTILFDLIVAVTVYLFLVLSSSADYRAKSQESKAASPAVREGVSNAQE